jgi:hypothetical protein
MQHEGTRPSARTALCLSVYLSGCLAGCVWRAAKHTHTSCNVPRGCRAGEAVAASRQHDWLMLQPSRPIELATHGHVPADGARARSCSAGRRPYADRKLLAIITPPTVLPRTR